MYETLSEFLRTAAAGNPLLWSLLVTAVVAVTAVFLYSFWEGLFRLVRRASRPGTGSATGPCPTVGPQADAPQETPQD